MPDNKSISQLTTAEQTTSSDLFETAIPNGSLGYLSRKVSLDAIAQFIAKALQYSDLQTEAKTLIDAINEAAQSGGGGASIEEMTQAQYNALTPEQKADGTLRAISDATTSINDIDDVNVSSPANGDALIYDSTSSKWVNSEIEADAVAYDNTSSGLTATDVQAAIDEVVDEKVDTGEVITFTPETGVTVNALSSWKTDRLCGISFDLKGITTTAGTMTTIGTVDILPSAVVRSGIANVGNGSHVGIARINVSGNIGITTESALSSSSSIAFSFVYRSRT